MVTTRSQSRRVGRRPRGNSNDRSDSEEHSRSISPPEEEPPRLGRGCRVPRPQAVTYDMMYVTKALLNNGSRRRADEDENGELLIHSKYPERAAARRAVERMGATLVNLDQGDSMPSIEEVRTDNEGTDAEDAVQSRKGRPTRTGNHPHESGSNHNHNNGYHHPSNGDNHRGYTDKRATGDGEGTRSGRRANPLSQGSSNRVAATQSQRKRDRDSSMDSSISNESLRECHDQDAKEQLLVEHSSSESISAPPPGADAVRVQRRRAKECVERNAPINQYLARAIDGPEAAAAAEAEAKAKERQGRRRRMEDFLLGHDTHRSAPETPTDATHLGRAESPPTGTTRGEVPAPIGDITPLRIDPTVTFAHVGGLPGHIVQLREMVLFPLLYTELLRAMHVTPPRGVLFVGPPGTGKTLMARALANEATHCTQRKITFFMRKGADILSKWVGESERQLSLLFEEAKRQQPSIIFFDEMDGLVPVRHTKSEQSQAALVSTFLALLDGLDDRGQVVVIGATNRPDAIDPALRRPGRFDRELYFPLPDAAARRHILSIVTAPLLPTCDPRREEILSELTVHCEGWSGAELHALCVEAGMNRLRSALPQLYTTSARLRVPQVAPEVRREDFFVAIHRVRRSGTSSTGSTTATAGGVTLEEHMEPLLAEMRANLLQHVAMQWPSAASVLRRERRDCGDTANAVRELSGFSVPHAARPLLLCLTPKTKGFNAVERTVGAFATEKAAVALARSLPSLRTFAVHLPQVLVDYSVIPQSTEEDSAATNTYTTSTAFSTSTSSGAVFVAGHIHAAVAAVRCASGPSLLLLHGFDVWLAEFGLPAETRPEHSAIAEEERDERRRRVGALRYFLGLLRGSDVLIVVPTAIDGAAEVLHGCEGIRTSVWQVPCSPGRDGLLEFAKYIFRVSALALSHCLPAVCSPLPEDNTPPPPPTHAELHFTRARELDLWRRVEHRRQQLRYVLSKWVGQYLTSRKFSIFLSADLDFTPGHELYKPWQRFTNGRRIGLLDVMEKLENEEYTCLSQYHDDIDLLVRNVRSFFRTRSMLDQRYRSRAHELKEMTVVNLYKINHSVVRFCEEHRDLVEPDFLSAASSVDGVHTTRDTDTKKKKRTPLIPISAELLPRRPPKRHYFGYRRRRRVQPPPLKRKKAEEEKDDEDDDDDDDDDGEANEDGVEEAEVGKQQRVATALGKDTSNYSHQLDEMNSVAAIGVIDAAVQKMLGLSFLQLHRLFQMAMPLLELEIDKRRKIYEERVQQQAQEQEQGMENEEEEEESQFKNGSTTLTEMENSIEFFERMFSQAIREVQANGVNK